MPRLQVGCDWDEVLITGAEVGFITYLKQNGWSFDHDCFGQTHCWDAATKRSDEEVTRAYHKYLQTGETHRHARAVNGACRALQELCKSCDLHIITAVPKEGAKYVSDLRKQYFRRIPFHSINLGQLKRKSSIIASRGIHIHIDDNDEEIELILNSGSDAILFQFPNYHCLPKKRRVIDHPNVIRLPQCDDAHCHTHAKDYTAIWQDAWDCVVQGISALTTFRFRCA